MELPTLWYRLRKRKLVTWTAAYLTGAVALFGALETVGDVFAWPDRMLRAVFFVLLAGLLATVVLAWFHGEKGRQRVTPLEALLLALAGALGLGGVTVNLPNTAPASVLVVHPFADTSPTGDQTHLAEGIAEELRRALGLRTGMPVARRAVGRDADVRILEGSVQRIAGRLRVSAQLTDGLGREIWSDRYELQDDRLFDVQDRIADEVARRIVGVEGVPASRRVQGPLDPDAHDAFLRGEYELRHRSPTSMVQAIGYYRQASALAPGFAPALAREAYAYAIFVDWGWAYPGLGPDDLLARGRMLAARAIEIDSLSAEGWLSHAYVTQLTQPDDPAAALDAFSKAVELDPTNPEAHHQLGQTLMVLARFAEAKAAYHAALALEPDRPMTLVPLAAVALREGDIEGARRWSDSAVVLAGDAPYPWASRARMRLVLGDAAGAKTDAEEALRIDPSQEVAARSTRASALEALEDSVAALTEVERARRAMVRPETPSPTDVYYLATALVTMGRHSEALDLIEAARPRSAWLAFYLAGPAFDPIRGHVRFARVLAEAHPPGVRPIR